MGFCFVSDAARRYGVRPRDISRLLYERVLPDEACPIVSGRRMIPDEYMPEIETALRERGLIAAEQPAEAAK